MYNEMAPEEEIATLFNVANRDGLESLNLHLKENGFYDKTPDSHSSAEHGICVFRQILKLKSAYKSRGCLDSMIIVGILHDTPIETIKKFIELKTEEDEAIRHITNAKSSVEGLELSTILNNADFWVSSFAN